MCIATVLSLFLVPVLYIVIKSMEERGKPHKHAVLVDETLDGHGSDQSTKAAASRSLDKDRL
jgi:HAE1 family hydrophobic/amphiphilic exporter-1